jgi:L-lactate permease
LPTPLSLGAFPGQSALRPLDREPFARIACDPAGAANTSGGVVGKMINPQNLTIAATPVLGWMLP